MRGRTNISSAGGAVANGKIKEFTVANGENIKQGEFVSVKYNAQKDLIYQTAGVTNSQESKAIYVGKYGDFDIVMLVPYSGEIQMIIYKTMNLVRTVNLGRSNDSQRGEGTKYVKAYLFNDKIIFIKSYNDNGTTVSNMMYYNMYKLQISGENISAVKIKSDVFKYVDASGSEQYADADTVFGGCIFEKLNDEYLVYGSGGGKSPFCLYKVVESDLEFVSFLEKQRNDLLGSVAAKQNKIIVFGEGYSHVLNISEDFSSISMGADINVELNSGYYIYVTNGLTYENNVLVFFNDGFFVHLDSENDLVIENKKLIGTTCTYGFVKNGKLYALCIYSEKLKLIVYNFSVFLTKEHEVELFDISKSRTSVNCMVFDEDNFKLIYGDSGNSDSSKRGFFSARGELVGNSVTLGDEELVYKYNGDGESIGFSKTGGASGQKIKVYVPIIEP